MNRTTELANLVMEKFGYVVMSWRPGLLPPPEPRKIWSTPISSAWPDANGETEYVAGPFFAVSETTFDDYRRNAIAAGTPPERIPSPLPGQRYFRLVAE